MNKIETGDIVRVEIPKVNGQIKELVLRVGKPTGTPNRFEGFKIKDKEQKWPYHFDSENVIQILDSPNF